MLFAVGNLGMIWIVPYICFFLYATIAADTLNVQMPTRENGRIRSVIPELSQFKVFNKIQKTRFIRIPVIILQ